MPEKRLLQLYIVLKYDSDLLEKGKNNYLTAGQRICINQERGYLMHDKREFDEYEQSEVINDKVDFILQQMREKNLIKAYASDARENL